MENLIAKLLRDFEDGFLNRRQLIQSLAVAATAAGASRAYAQTPAGAAAAGASTSAAHSPAFKTIELDHVSYQVKDYRVTRDFYAGLMGMEVANDNGKNQCELRFANSMVIARNRRQPSGDSTAPAPAAGGRPQPTSLVDHIAYRVYNWDSDPDGFNLQISGWAGPNDSVNKKK
jgi:catechol 2,3-dioxygenase-like lactoylglutathione lyase family enzyme